jgi:hypothetical protein
VSARHDVLVLFRRAVGNKPVVWASERTTLGDYEGHDVTLEVFDVPAEEQRDLLRTLRPERQAAADLLGGPVQVVFHTPDATSRHHAWVRDEAMALDVAALVRPQATAAVAPSEEERERSTTDASPLLGVDERPRARTPRAA